MKYIDEIKEIVAEQAYEQLKHNLNNVDTKELGEAVDMIKDMAEASYYCSVVEAMEKAEKEAEERGRTVYYTERFIPYFDDWSKEDKENYMDNKYNPRRYADQKTRNEDNRMEMNDTRRYNKYVPYYDYNEPVARDMREGRSPMTRRMYMEAKTQHQGKEIQLQELEKYMGELSQDVTEMISDASPEEKQMLHKKLVALTDKIALLMK